MQPDHCLESELAARLDGVERGTPLHESITPLTAEVDDLLTIAHQLRTMPPVRPDRGWLQASKRRLLARYEATQARSGRHSDDRPSRPS